MNKKTFIGKFWLGVLLCLMLVIPAADAFAWGKSGHSRHEVVTVGHRRYRYHDGRFYKPGFFGLGLFVVRPPLGAVVTVIPAGHKTFIFGGITYYYHDEVYYKACPSGYMVVPAPVVNLAAAAPDARRPQNLAGEKVTVNVPNSKGGYTPVVLVKNGNGYIGPQGEYYPGNPTVEQLRALYGN